MLNENDLRRLAENVAPSDAVRRGIMARIENRIQPIALQQAVQSVDTTPELKKRIKSRVLRGIGVSTALDLQEVSQSTLPSLAAFQRIKSRVLGQLEPMEDVPLFASSLKWASAFAVFLVIIRSLPIILLAPSTSAEAGVQLLPVDGTVSMYIDGTWQDVTSPHVLTSATTIKTGPLSHATVIMNDDGVFRMGPDTVMTLHDLADRPSVGVSGPMATLVHGQLWSLGLLPPVTDGLSIEVSSGVVSLNIGSVGITDDGTESVVTVYDRGATVQHGNQTVFAVTGESVRAREGLSLRIASIPTVAFTDQWVTKNLEQDAVHRNDIAKLQEDRRTELAGILPTSFFYPAKRLAEHVDVFFTLTQDGRTEKRIAQANTRLNEAIALMRAGESDEAAASLTAYKDSLISMASDTDDNLVKHLLKKQIADASVSIGSAGNAAASSIDLLKTALADVGTAVPDATLDAKDIEGYVLVDRLAQINQQLANGRDIQGAITSYATIRPYVKSLLSEDSGVHPLLKKEATSLLVTTSTLLTEIQSTREDPILAALSSDIAPYVPEEPQVKVSEAELNNRVQAMYDRIFIFRSPLSRYNQLQVEMKSIAGDANRGTLLRRLKAALPIALGEYVNTEIKLLGDELKYESKSTLTNEGGSGSEVPQNSL